MRDFVQVDASVSELREHFSGEYKLRCPPCGSGKLHDHEPASEASDCWLVGTARRPRVMTEGHTPRCPAFE